MLRLPGCHLHDLNMTLLSGWITSGVSYRHQWQQQPPLGLGVTACTDLVS